MSSRIEQATVALVTLLAAIPSTTVERNRDIPVDFITAEQSCLVVTDGDDADVAFVASNTVEFATNLQLAGYVTADDFADLGPARDALWLATWNVVTANPRLGSELTWDVTPGPTARRVEFETGKPVAVFEMPVTLRVKAQASDPAVAA